MKGVYHSSEELAAQLRAAGFNTVTFGDLSEVDLNKQSLFPLAHVVLSSLDLNTSTAVINYDLVVMDAIDHNTNDPRNETTPFNRTDNVEDVYHDLATKVNVVVQNYFRSPSVDRIEGETVSMDAFMYEYENNLAGYLVSIPVLIDNVQEGYC